MPKSKKYEVEEFFLESTTSKKSKLAQELLRDTAQILDERGAHYSQGNERNMERIVAAFNAMTGHNLTTFQGWLFMVALKGVRAGWDSSPSMDTVLDGAGYFALAAEELQRKP